jgi:hypothetical protein
MFGQSLFAWREGKTEFREAQPEYAPYRRYVEKMLLPIVICTDVYRVVGYMHLTYHHRALDVLNGPEAFIPVTNAQIYNISTGELFAEQEFVAISKDKITILYETGLPIPPEYKAGEAGAEGSEPQSQPGSAAPKQ